MNYMATVFIEKSTITKSKHELIIIANNPILVFMFRVDLNNSCTQNTLVILLSKIKLYIVLIISINITVY